MNLPHDIRFITHVFFAKALRKWGLADQFLKTGIALAKLQELINRSLLGKRSKNDETAIIQAIAEVEIYLSQIVEALGAQNDAKMAIQAKLAELNDEALRKP